MCNEYVAAMQGDNLEMNVNVHGNDSLVLKMHV